jgi:hypothetical protein
VAGLGIWAVEGRFVQLLHRKEEKDKVYGRQADVESAAAGAAAVVVADADAVVVDAVVDAVADAGVAAAAAFDNNNVHCYWTEKECFFVNPPVVYCCVWMLLGREEGS